MSPEFVAILCPIVAIVLTVGLVIFMVKTAVPGHQDETGFHFDDDNHYPQDDE